MSANTYATVAECVTRLGDRLYGLLNVAVGADVSANATLLAEIESANARVDMSLAGRYELPLTEIDAALVRAACDLVQWQLATRRVDVMTEADRDAGTRGEDLLNKIALGTARLSVAGGANAGKTIPSPVALSIGSTAVEGRDELANQPWMDGF